MYKFVLLAVGMSIFSSADYMSESDLLIQQNLEDIKNKYHIQDETPPKDVEIENKVPSLPSIKKETLHSDAASNTEEATKMDDVISSMKALLPTEKESTPAEDEDKLEKIRRELGIKDLTDKEKKLDQIRHELDINYASPQKESYLDKRLSSVQEALHMEGEIEGEYSFSNSVRDLKKTLHLDGDSSWDLGLGSLFGEEKKKKKPLFGLSVLGGVQDTGKSIYKGMKYSGQSAEMMSGMMYNSSKMYNTMFGVFDDSPFNIFEEEEEASMFDFIEGGNSIMRMFD